MVIKPHLFGATPVFILTPPGQCNQQNILALELTSDHPRRFIAIHPRHPDIRQNRMRQKLASNFNRLFAIIGNAYIVSLQSHNLAQHIDRGPVIVSKECLAACRSCSARFSFVTSQTSATVEFAFPSRKTAHAFQSTG